MDLFRILLFFVDVLICLKAQNCQLPIGRVYGTAGLPSKLQFDISRLLPSVNEAATLTLLNIGQARGSIRYAFGQIQLDPGAGISFAANLQGIVNVTIQDVQISTAYGTFGLQKPQFTAACICLYVLGIPSQPIIRGSEASVGSSVTLTCGSISTTTPSNHSLNLLYNWKVDNVDNPTESRYSYTLYKRTLTITGIVKADATKQITCTAREDVTNGYTSLSSGTTNINVLYGPETMRFSPPDEEYENEENTDLAHIICKADCNPSCTFRWTKQSDLTIISSTEILQLGTLSGEKAGLYSCTATRSGSVQQTKNLTLNVVYGPRNIVVLPNTPGPIRQDEGSELFPMACSAQCWLCEFTWTGPTGFRSNNSSLITGTLNRSSHGEYICTATNIKLSSRPQLTTRVYIEVRYGPSSVTLSPGSTSYIVDELTQLSDIVCSADCFPTCSYQWTKQGQSKPVSITGTLPLGTVNKNYAGNYTCTATNTDLSPQKFVTSKVDLKVRYGPYQNTTTVTPAALQYTVKEGQPVSDITCQADCFPECTYSWNKHETGLVISRSGLLSLGTVNRHVAGVYICRATNPGKLLSNTTLREIEIKVNYGPDTADVSVSQSYETIEGQNVPDITCNSDCFPMCSLTWKNSTHTLSSSEKLILGKVTRQQAGNYTCTSFNNANDAKTVSKTIQLIVNYAPAVNVRLNSSDIAEKSILVLSCEGAGVPARYAYTGLSQTFGSVEIPNTNRAIGGTTEHSNILFTSLQLQDTGTYTCRLNNGIQDLSGRLDQSASLNLTVRGIPKVLKSDSVFAAATNSSVTISIPFYCYPAVTSIHFARLNSMMVIGGEKYNISLVNSVVYDNFYGKIVALDGYQARLTIASLREHDFGTYLLNITNDQGATSFQFFVSAESPPMVPKYFIYSSEPDLSSFIWSKDFNGGHIQTFLIETTIPGSGMWNMLISVLESDTQHQINESVYFAYITGLPPGTYTARIIAWNSIGTAEPLYLNSTFTVVSDVNDSDGGSQPGNSGAVIGGAVGGGTACAILIAVIVLIFRRIRTRKDNHPPAVQFCDGNGEKRLALNDTTAIYTDLQTSQHVYTNMTSEYSELTTRSDSSSKAVPEDAKVYVNLQMIHYHPKS